MMESMCKIFLDFNFIVILVLKMILWHGQQYFGKMFVINMNLLLMLMAARMCFFLFILNIYIYEFIRMRQYKLIEGPFPPESVFTGEIGRLKSYEKQKPLVFI